MSSIDAIAHPAGPLVDGKRHCANCGLELPQPERWEDGERVCIGTLLTPYSVPPSMDLDDDEVLCGGVVDVGERLSS